MSSRTTCAPLRHLKGLILDLSDSLNRSQAQKPTDRRGHYTCASPNVSHIRVLTIAAAEAELGEPALATMRSLKRALDPLDILNPGKIISLG